MSEPIRPDESHDRVTLSPKDAAAVDALLEAGGGARLHLARDADEVAQRANRAAAWLKVLGAAPTLVPPADLLQKTLDAVAADRMKLHPQPMTKTPAHTGIAPAEAPRPRSRKVAEIAAMFAAALLLVAVIIPATSQARRSAARVACSGNLKDVGTAFASYGATYSHELPSLAMPANRNWLHGDTDTAARSNSEHLLPLLTGRYLSAANLICAGRKPAAEPAATLAATELPDLGYSYVNLYGPSRPTWDNAASTIILADRNPLFTDNPGSPSADANSPNHGGKGNYVVHADQSVTWDMSPNIGPGGDNIWTLGSGPQRRTNYNGTEVPSAYGDVFIAP